MPTHDTILRRVADYYTARLAHHGPTARGVDWKDDASHGIRHRQFLRLLSEDRDASILDLGCGYGDFFAFLRENGFAGRYVGYDVSAEMIAAARQRHGDGPDRTWRVGAELDETADYAIASGIFNVKGDVPAAEWERYVGDTITLLARFSTRGFGFNVLSLSSDPERRRPDLYYADPATMLADCMARYGRSVALLQDYGLYEFTLLVRKA